MFLGASFQWKRSVKRAPQIASLIKIYHRLLFLLSNLRSRWEKQQIAYGRSYVAYSRPHKNSQQHKKQSRDTTCYHTHRERETQTHITFNYFNMTKDKPTTSSIKRKIYNKSKPVYLFCEFIVANQRYSSASAFCTYCCCVLCEYIMCDIVMRFWQMIQLNYSFDFCAIFHDACYNSN